uniref:Uncharacterized protein n=1 Tax=Glossina austeni TaxID=7395 RepID=A0A1A9URC6_GLOAU
MLIFLISLEISVTFDFKRSIDLKFNRNLWMRRKCCFMWLMNVEREEEQHEKKIDANMMQILGVYKKLETEHVGGGIDSLFHAGYGVQRKSFSEVKELIARHLVFSNA